MSFRSMSAKSLSAGFRSVSTGPGCTLLIVMPRWPRSRARPLTSPTSAALLMAYPPPPHKWHALGIATANGDDAPARLHVLHGGLRGDEHGAHVHGDGAIKILQAIIIKGCHHGNARIVHQNV